MNKIEAEYNDYIIKRPIPKKNEMTGEAYILLLKLIDPYGTIEKLPGDEIIFCKSRKYDMTKRSKKKNDKTNTDNKRRA